MRIYQANLGRGVSAAEFTRNLETVLASAGPSGFIVPQEIDEADGPEEMQILKRLTRGSHRIVGDRTSVPILVPKRFEVLATTVTFACKGLPRVTPHRVVVEAVVRLKPGLTVGLANTHLPINRPAAQSRRAQVRRTLRRRTRRLHRVGLPGTWTADTNTRPPFPAMVPGEVPIISAGIDITRGWTVPGRRIEVTDRWDDDLTIDGHNGHGARVLWHNTKEKA